MTALHPAHPTEPALPRVSVVTVCYNSARTIRRTVASVLAQQYPALEYVVVDGGSTDGTLDILEEYRPQLSKVVSEPDEGIYDAMNKGLRLASGEWIHILNSDDYYAADDVLRAAIPRLDPGRTNYFQMWREYADGRRDLQDWTYRRWRLFVSAFLPHPALIVSRSQYETIGLYDTSYRIAADHDMILRLTGRWPGLKHDLPLTVMQQGGVSGVEPGCSLREFSQVTRGHGLPALVAALIQSLKRIWWKI